MAASSLSHSEIVDLIPAYALGSLDEDDARLVIGHLDRCAECRDELRNYEDLIMGVTVAVIPQVPVPASLQHSLMERIKPLPPASPAETPQSVLRRLFAAPRLGFAIGVAALLVVTVFATILWGGTRPTGLARSVQMRGTELAPDATALFEIGGSMQATLSVAGLPPTAADQQYQLWLIKPDGTRDSGAVFSVKEDGTALVHITAPEPLNRYSGLGVTIEPAGGSPGPTGPRILYSS